MSRTVVIVDAAQIYLGVRDVLGLPTLRPNRSAMLATLRRQVSGMGVVPWRIIWVDACMTFHDRFDLEDLELEDGVFVKIGEVVRGRQKMVDGLVAQAIQQAAAWPGVSEIYVVAGDTDYVPFVSEAVASGVSMCLLHVAGSGSAIPALRRRFDRVSTLEPLDYKEDFLVAEVEEAQVDRSIWVALVERLGWEDAMAASEAMREAWESERYRSIPWDVYGNIGQRLSVMCGKSRFEGNEKGEAIAAWWRGVDRAVGA